MVVLPVLAHNSPVLPCLALPCPVLPRLALPCSALHCPTLPHSAMPCHVLRTCAAYCAADKCTWTKTCGCAGSAVVWPELHVRLHDPLPPGFACANGWGKYISLCSSIQGLVCIVGLSAHMKPHPLLLPACWDNLARFELRLQLWSYACSFIRTVIQQFVDQHRKTAGLVGMVAQGYNQVGTHHH